ncbi:flagellar biosynthesis protein FlhF [Neobacillus sp. D3-1R]|uniref:flagellar biosynthesis protein FlhF n=1 Tax=Neobacillus sp. D3-1R TaxID=3445778 RepID=UPI003F9FF0A2
MKVKKYVAANMPEVMKIIRAELGNDAVILNSKIVQTGGFLGFFKKKNIEVIAAIDPKPNQTSTTRDQVNRPLAQTITHKPIEKDKEPTEYPEVKINHSKNTDELLSEITELKSLMKNLASQQVKTAILPEPIQKIELHLQNQEMSSILIEKLVGKLLEKWFLEGANSSEKELIGWASEEISKEIMHLHYAGISFDKKYVNVVGPTGVGKTTTLAKMAAECVLKYKKKVAFITTDTYRIAAIDQLKTYAKILNVPIEVCYNIQDFHEATKKFQDYDVVLIDTAGRNFRNQQYVEDLKKIIDFQKDMESFLVLALTSKQKDMEDIFKQFSTVKIDRLIFTKVDETSVYGSMLNLIINCQLGVAYLTNGQDVPDDLITATPEAIANTILGVEMK